VSNRLTLCVRAAKKNKRKLICIYITLGFTNLKVTERLIVGLDREGVDILELGFPFSDPLADGPTIQAASQHALQYAVTVQAAARVVAKARRRGVRMPIIFFSYVNPIMQFGVRRFSRKIKQAGFDGVICPDLPPDEEPKWIKAMTSSGLSFVNLVAPTSSDVRIKYLTARSNDFVYYVSRRGVTGERKKFEQGLVAKLRRIRCLTTKPVLVGFGVSTPKQAKQLAMVSDGVVVGSAVISAIRRARGRTGPVLQLVRRFVRAVREAERAGRGRTGYVWKQRKGAWGAS